MWQFETIQRILDKMVILYNIDEYGLQVSGNGEVAFIWLDDYFFTFFSEHESLESLTYEIYEFLKSQ